MKFDKINLKLIVLIIAICLVTNFETEFHSESSASSKSKAHTNTENKFESKSKEGINMSEGKLKSHKSHGKSSYHEMASQNIQPVIQPVAQPIVQPVTQPVTLPTTQLPPITPPIPQPDCKTNTIAGTTSNVFQNTPNSQSTENNSILFTSWIKYFKIADNTNAANAPKTFYKNNAYYEQFKLFTGVDMTRITNDGVNNLEEYIKSPSHFYAILFPNNLNILTSRQVSMLANILVTITEDL
jgi:hypothetical protein